MYIFEQISNNNFGDYVLVPYMISGVTAREHIRLNLLFQNITNYSSCMATLKNKSAPRSYRCCFPFSLSSVEVCNLKFFSSKVTMTIRRNDVSCEQLDSNSETNYRMNSFVFLCFFKTVNWRA